MINKSTHGRIRTELLQDIMKNRTNVKLKDLALDGKAWNQE